MNRADYEELTQQQSSRDRLLEMAKKHPEHFTHYCENMLRVLMGKERFEDFGKGMTIKQLVARNADIFQSSLQKSDDVTQAIDHTMSYFNRIKTEPVQRQILPKRKDSYKVRVF